jgi:uncharacterized protein
VTDERVAEPRPIRLRASDGVEVEADLAVASQAWAGAVVCHPHPAYGGTRHNVVVERIFRTLVAAGMTVLRFDFRPAGDGDGTGGEELDVLAAIEQTATHLAPELPLWLVGYSFGADIALSVGDERIAGWVAVAPPLRFGSPPRPGTGDERPALVLAAEHDQFSSPDRLRTAASTWPAATVTVIPAADHFLAGATAPVATTIRSWIEEQGSAGHTV